MNKIDKIEESYKVHRKSVYDIALEWDRLAPIRDQQIRSGKDYTFEHLTCPIMSEFLKKHSSGTILDIGCGTGHFTKHISDRFRRVIGIEPSVRSCNIAQGVCGGVKNISILNSTLEEYSLTGCVPVDQKVESACAVMVLMNVPNLREFISALNRTLPVGGLFSTILTHPSGWPRYWGYEQKKWFNYNKEIFIEAPFRISQEKTELVTTHIHRPVNAYMHALQEGGFRFEQMFEPLPQDADRASMLEYEKYPRFLVMQWSKSGS